MEVYLFRGAGDFSFVQKSLHFSIGLDYRYKPKWPIFIAGYIVNFIGSSRAAIGFGYDTLFVDVYVSTIDIFSIVTGGARFSASLVLTE